MAARRTQVCLAVRAMMAQQAANQKGMNMTTRKKTEAPRITRRVLTTAETIRLSDWLRVPGQLDGCTTAVEVAQKAHEAEVVLPPASVGSIRSLIEALQLKLGESEPASTRVMRKLVEVCNLLVEVAAANASTPQQEGYVREASTRLSEARALILVEEQRAANNG